MRLPLRRGSDAISPTAHYTGHVWGRNGLSHPQLATVEGRLLFGALAPANELSRLLGGPTLERALLARHRTIDRLLGEAIDAGRVSQVIEIACGMSPRGWRFARRYGERLTYVEADLPDMAERKRRALEAMGSRSGHHRVVELDALRDGGEASLAELAATLDERAGTAIVTEGLLTYFDEDDVLGMWRRFARELERFPTGLYLADIRLGGEDAALPDRVFVLLLSSFVGRRVHVHFDGEEGAEEALRAAGFASARVHRADRVHVVEARR